jgi:hypothetical protein
MKKHYQGITERMLSELESISNAMSHPGEKGKNNELVLLEFLRRHLPQRLSVSTGKVIAANGEESDQIDLIIHDRLNTPAFIDAHAWSIVPIESVFAVISVKTNLTKPELKHALKSIQSVRRLPNLAALMHKDGKFYEANKVLKPRAFVFAYDSKWKNIDSLNKGFQDVLLEIDDSLRPNGLCVLKQSFIVRKAFKTETVSFNSQPLMHFFSFLVRTIDNFGNYHVDLSKYLTEDFPNS